MAKNNEKQQMEEIEVKVNKWDATAVKHALDDAVKNALFATRPQLKEQFGLINTRLVVCTLAVGVAVLAHGWDFTHPFPESKPVLMFCVVAYFVLMGILTLHTTFREKATFAVAVEKSSNGSEKEVKVNKWDATAVKHALDDAVKNALLATRPQLKEQFGLINTRLVICTLAVGAAVLAHGWDFTHPFPESKPVLMFCVVAYFVLMGILTLHTTFREKGTFAVAVEKSSNGSEKVWEASSDMKKYDDKYTLVLSVKDSKSLREATSVKTCQVIL